MHRSVPSPLSSGPASKLATDLRALQPHHRLPHSKVDVPAARPGSPDGVVRLGLANGSVARACEARRHVPRDPRSGGGGIPDALAACDGCQRSTMERTGRKVPKMNVAARKTLGAIAFIASLLILLFAPAGTLSFWQAWVYL